MTAKHKAIAGALALLGETFNQPVSELRARAYLEALSDLSADAVVAACKRAIRESRFFPTPAELREMVEGNPTDRAEGAWTAMRALVRRYGYYTLPPDHAWPDEAVKRAAMELYGGWQALCSRLPAEGPEMLGAAKQFKANYLAHSGRQRYEQALPSVQVVGYLNE